MMFQYLFYLSVICFASVLSTVVFFLIAMNTDDEEGVGLWGAAISIVANLVISTFISVLFVVCYLK